MNAKDRKHKGATPKAKKSTPRMRPASSGKTKMPTKKIAKKTTAETKPKQLKKREACISRTRDT